MAGLSFKELCIGACARLLGRKGSVRVGRALLMAGQLDGRNDMEMNGEGIVQDVVLRDAPRDRPLVVFDVGANLGQWTQRLLRSAREAGREDLRVHAFEPALATYTHLCKTLEREVLEGQVTPVRKALSNAVGSASLFLTSELAGSNSLHDQSRGFDESRASESVELSTVDVWCGQHGIEELTLLKSDAEGHDFAVLEGASGMLRAGRIGVVQFEYNWRWVDSRHFLRDALDLFAPFDYRVGKVTHLGIEFYEGWDFELETFRESNYLACRADWAERFPKVAWWKR